MADSLQYASGNSSSTTLSSGVTNSDTSVPLTSDTNFEAKSGEGMTIIDEGQATEEFAYATGKTGSALDIPLANRGLEGGSAQAHAAGSTVKGIITAGMWNNLIDAVSLVVSKTAGTLLKATGATINTGTDDATIVTPKAIADSNVLLTTKTQTVTNKTITPVALINTVVSYTPDAAATATLNLATGNIHKITMPAGNITIAISNEAVGQCFLVEITQDDVGSRTVTWFTTIKWAGGSAPTLTTTASKRDVFGFRVTAADQYDGYIVGQSI